MNAQWVIDVRQLLWMVQHQNDDVGQAARRLLDEMDAQIYQLATEYPHPKSSLSGFGSRPPAVKRIECTPSGVTMVPLADIKQSAVRLFGPDGRVKDEWVDRVCGPGRAERWRGDGRQYDRDTAKLVVEALLKEL